MRSLPVNILLLFIHHTIVVHIVIHVLLGVLALLNLGLVHYLLHRLLLAHVVWVVYDLLLHVVLCLLLLVHVLVVLALLLKSLGFFQLVVFELGEAAFVAGVSESEVLV